MKSRAKNEWEEMIMMSAKPSKRDDQIDSEGYFVFFNIFYEQKNCEIVASSF